jgi:hypothetical protein
MVTLSDDVGDIGEEASSDLHNEEKQQYTY